MNDEQMVNIKTDAATVQSSDMIAPKAQFTQRFSQIKLKWLLALGELPK